MVWVLLEAGASLVIVLLEAGASLVWVLLEVGGLVWVLLKIGGLVSLKILKFLSVLCSCWLRIYELALPNQE